MEKDVRISIRGTQKSEGEEPQVIELTTDGKLFHGPEGVCVSYVESELTGLEGVVTTFCVEQDKIVLRREGELSSIMIFEEGKKNESLYDMGFGAMLVGVCAKKVRAAMSDCGGSMFVDYDVEVERTPLGTNIYEIDVREVTGAETQGE